MIDEQTQNNGDTETNKVSADAGGESNTASNPDGDTSALWSGSNRLQNEQEFNLDKKTDHSNDDSITASGVDDLQENSDGAAGTDRAGTAERKDYGGTKLNQGLEEQGIEEYK